MLNLSKLATAVAVVVAAGAAAAGEVEVLHWWTSGGEAKSVAELKKIMEGKGHTWKDFAVAGGGGDAAMTVLKSRVVAGVASKLFSVAIPESNVIVETLERITDPSASSDSVTPTLGAAIGLLRREVFGQ